MLDIGWTELLVIAIVLIVVVGPKDLPPMLRAFGKMTSNLRKMAGDFRTQFDEALREADMDDVRQTLSDAKSLHPANALRDAINPLRQMGQEIRADLQKATAVPTAVDTATKVDDPLLTGESSQDAPAEVSAPVQTAAIPAAAPAPVVAAQADAVSAKPAPATKASVPDTLTAAPDLPAAKRRAPAKKAEPSAAKPKGDSKTVSKPAAAATKAAVKKPATETAKAVKPAANKTATKKTAAVVAEPAEAAPKAPRARKKAAAPKDDA